jgi:hypothetical protein
VTILLVLIEIVMMMIKLVMGQEYPECGGESRGTMVIEMVLVLV